MLDDEITIYFEEETRFAFTPFYYDPETCRGVVGPREGFNPMALGMGERFNEDVKRYSEIYTPIKVKRSVFEKLYEAASRNDKKLMEKILSEEFVLNSSS